MRAMRIGALDLGSNSFHLIVADVRADGAFEIIHRQKEIVRIGERTLTGGVIPPDVFRRALDALRSFKQIGERLACDAFIAVATSAIREAVNGGDFVRAVRDDLGIEVQVVRGDEEARLIYLGARAALDFKNGPGLIIDIGGGSMEVIVADARECYYTRSLKLGVLRLSEAFVAHDPIEAGERTRLVAHIHQTLDPVAAKVHALGFSFVALTSGTAHSVAALSEGRTSGSAGDGPKRLKRADAQAVADLVCKLPTAERMKLRGLDLRRADTIVPGAVLVASLMEVFGGEALLCDRALREGIIADYVSKHRSGLTIEEEVPDLRRRSVLSLARRCRSPEVHCFHVAGLVRSLFRQLEALHKLDEKDLEILEFSALLHDVGMLIGSSRHHKHAHYLITNDELRGLSPDEIRVIACVARYHRKATPKKEHEEFARLSDKQKHRVTRMAALLRIADGLDRSHRGVIKAVRCRDRGRTVEITLFTSGDCELELWGARRKADLFTGTFDRKLEFLVQPALSDDDDGGDSDATAASASSLPRLTGTDH